ncbi:MAG: ribonuclease III [Rhodovibrionaceae bacterium]
MASTDAAPGGDKGARQALARRLGHDFAKPDLLELALTHASHNSRPGGVAVSYERMEFLGDRVLGLVVADLLYHRFSGEDEGALARRFAVLVRRETLAAVAGEIELGKALILARGEEEAGSQENPAILSDCCEAVIAALYLDGGLEPARRFIAAYWTARLEADPTPPKDAKTELQEWAQGQGLPLPRYREVGRHGPAHEPHFTIEVTVEGVSPAEGSGSSKRQAEQSAAETLLGRAKS